jgi:hypothetical protein
MDRIKAYLELGKKRSFACAVDWPGWCRNGRNEDSALMALFEFGARYAQVLHNTDFDFQIPTEPGLFDVIERIEGNATTDFGAPAITSDADRIKLSESDFTRQVSLLQACWAGFDQAVDQAAGKELRKGPRGGGRDLEKIMHHVLEADRSYLRRLAWKPTKIVGQTIEAEIMRTREDAISALETALYEGLPEEGPRGGVIWTPRYFIRRVAWHVLDHAWEIEDRVV